jgi:hypothetical protein
MGDNSGTMRLRCPSWLQRLPEVAFGQRWHYGGKPCPDCKRRVSRRGKMRHPLVHVRRIEPVGSFSWQWTCAGCKHVGFADWQGQLLTSSATREWRMRLADYRRWEREYVQKGRAETLTLVGRPGTPLRVAAKAPESPQDATQALAERVGHAVRRKRLDRAGV